MPKHKRCSSQVKLQAAAEGFLRNAAPVVGCASSVAAEHTVGLGHAAKFCHQGGASELVNVQSAAFLQEGIADGGPISTVGHLKHLVVRPARRTHGHPCSVAFNLQPVWVEGALIPPNSICLCLLAATWRNCVCTRRYTKKGLSGEVLWQKAAVGVDQGRPLWHPIWMCKKQSCTPAVHAAEAQGRRGPGRCVEDELGSSPGLIDVTLLARCRLGEGVHCEACCSYNGAIDEIHELCVRNGAGDVARNYSEGLIRFRRCPRSRPTWCGGASAGLSICATCVSPRRVTVEGRRCAFDTGFLCHHETC
mmetsp:Transcript_98726/g.274731  ORF Transcript_98726/g.274731 Transcript_98726/m.274731 type:complete len:306 (+) Transcript_98726:611-1528(+)